ncbi:MAG: sn-glycerol-3-phosphate ABC transporter ATP-binding protein UgpC [Verrucomicrobia bacterium]|nr:sn-glycerol-3-phosphate ABC transporter ATP-binding protein UgpC [Verrucomicrobiota bacterium]
MAYLELEQIEKHYDDFHALKGIDLHVQKEEFVVFVGPSGCGKTTLLRSISGLESVTGGKIILDGRDITDIHPSRRNVAMVFQNYALFPHLSVFENIAFGLRLHNLGQREIRNRVERAANSLHLDQLLERKPKQLSGGQRQRVAIGRAIVKQPKLFLFDEPLSNLDAKLRVQMRVELLNLHYETSNTVVYVTHDQVEAMTMADKIVILNDGQIEQSGSPMNLYERPANKFVAGFIGSPQMNFLPAEIKNTDSSGLILISPVLEQARFFTAKSPIEGAVTLGIRPEHIRLNAAGPSLPINGIVNIVEKLGGEAYLHVEIATETRIMAKIQGSSGPVRGDKVTLHCPIEHLHLFDTNGRSIPLTDHTTEISKPDRIEYSASQKRS